MSDETTPSGGSTSTKGGTCRSQPLRARRDLPLREDCRYRKARLLVLLAYDATGAPASGARHETGSPSVRELRRAAVAAGSTVIREHEGIAAPIQPALGQLTDALARGESEGWLDATAAERLRRLSSELAAV
jgi:hypothetical protein